MGAKEDLDKIIERELDKSREEDRKERIERTKKAIERAKEKENK